MFDPDDSDECDALLQSVLRTSKDIQTKVRNVEDSMDQLRAVTGPYMDLSNSLKKLTERNQQHRRTINHLKSQNQALQAENSKMTESLSIAANEKKYTENSLATAQAEKINMQTQVSTLIREREGLLKMQTDTTQQIASMRTVEHEMSTKITRLNEEKRAQSTYIDDLKKQRLDDQKAESERQYSQKLQCEVQEYEMKHRQMKKTFESALKEAELETKKLAAERNEWFAKYNQLASDLEERKRRLNADVQKLLSEKWQEMMRSFNRHQASQNTRDANLMIRRPENLASKFMEELIGSSASDSSVFAHDQNDVPENAENVPPAPRASKKRSASAGLSGRQPLIQDVVGKVVSSHVNPRAFQSNTQQRNRAPPRNPFLPSRNQNQ
uniref:SWI5-dependent HO expression protein 3 n=1 Tax=Ditylenchus dipsaci TaxID=166011 RepID=A0A915DEZ3_9BILA